MPRKNSLEKMQIISVHLPPKMIEMIDRIVSTGFFSNRSEFIRAALSEFLNKWYNPQNGQQQQKQNEVVEEDLGILEAK